MALLADLGQFKQGFTTDLKASAYRYIPEIKSLKDQVLAKVAIGHISSLILERIDLFKRQQADLPVPLAGMGVPFDPMVSSQQGR